MNLRAIEASTKAATDLGLVVTLQAKNGEIGWIVVGWVVVDMVNLNSLSRFATDTTTTISTVEQESRDVFENL